MPNVQLKNRSLPLAAAISLALFASQVVAQEGPREEVIVTGSYIKRDTFDAPSPTEVIDGAAIQESGAPSMGMFIRDLTFTQNTDVVANVLGTQDGQQDSVSASFNIRGLGTGSTLTLFDGRRVVNPTSAGSIVPELALERFEAVLDGGAALYGTDAVAGVVNLIPVKKFDGFKTRAFYNQVEDNAYHQPKYSVLAGTSFFDALDVVVAADWTKRTALYRAERPEFLRADNDSSVSGNPGVYTRITGGTAYVDPSCGTFNLGREDHGMQGSFPSGIPTYNTSGALSGCTFEYGQYQDYGRPYEETLAYVSAVYALNDKINIEFQGNFTWNNTTLLSSPSTALTANNTKIVIPATNPGNMSGVALRPGTATGSGWRPFTGYGTLPSRYDHRGLTNSEYEYFTDRYKLGLTYDFGDSSWSGETWVSTQLYREHISGQAPLLSRMQAALNGQGGPNGNQYWNPFGSSDPRSPYYTPARANSQELVDWIWTDDEVDSVSQRLKFIETIATGDLFKLPAGAVAMAIGGQVRELTRTERAAPAAFARDDYNSDIFLQPEARIVTDNQVRAVFAEFNIPILSSLEMQIAGRHEDFVDLDLKATSPKVAVRYQPFRNLAIRASYGEGFLAPTPNQVLVEDAPDCAEVFTGVDPFFPGVAAGNLNGSTSCRNGNPDLKPEESTVYNIGFSWEIIDDLEFSLDFQTIEYTDRIIEMGSADILNRDFANFLAANGLSASSYTAATWNSTANAALRQAWFASGMDPDITRGPLQNSVNKVSSVVRSFENLSTNEVDVFDAKLKYSFDVGSFGYFTSQYSGTYFSRYEYSGLDKVKTDGVGLQNGNTNLAPPLPQWKHQLRTAWALGNHTAAVTGKHQSGVKFDTLSIAPGATRPDRISSYTTFDVRYGYDFRELAFGELSLAIGSSNVTNEKPDRLPIIAGFETRLGDPFGRQYYAEAIVTF